MIHHVHVKKKNKKNPNNYEAAKLNASSHFNTHCIVDRKQNMEYQSTNLGLFSYHTFIMTKMWNQLKQDHMLQNVRCSHIFCIVWSQAIIISSKNQKIFPPELFYPTLWWQVLINRQGLIEYVMSHFLRYRKHRCHFAYWTIHENSVIQHSKDE